MKRRTASTGVTLAVLCALVAGCDGEADRETRLSELRQQRNALILEYNSVQNPLRGVQARALTEPGVQAAMDTFRAALWANLGTDPEAADLLRRAEAVGGVLEELAAPIILAPGETMPESRSSEARNRTAQELIETERRLRPFLRAALPDSTVAERFQTLQDSVVATMLRLEPGVQPYLDHMRDLELRIASIGEEIAALDD